jgi:hypothetical protein
MMNTPQPAMAHHTGLFELIIDLGCMFQPNSCGLVPEQAKFGWRPEQCREAPSILHLTGAGATRPRVDENAICPRSVNSVGVLYHWFICGCPILRGPDKTKQRSSPFLLSSHNPHHHFSRNTNFFSRRLRYTVVSCGACLLTIPDRQLEILTPRLSSTISPSTVTNRPRSHLAHLADLTAVLRRLPRLNAGIRLHHVIQKSHLGADRSRRDELSLRWPCYVAVAPVAASRQPDRLDSRSPL